MYRLLFGGGGAYPAVYTDSFDPHLSMFYCDPRS